MLFPDSVADIIRNKILTQSRCFSDHYLSTFPHSSLTKPLRSLTNSGEFVRPWEFCAVPSAHKQDRGFEIQALFGYVWASDLVHPSSRDK